MLVAYKDMKIMTPYRNIDHKFSVRVFAEENWLATLTTGATESFRIHYSDVFFVIEHKKELADGGDKLLVFSMAERRVGWIFSHGYMLNVVELEEDNEITNG